MDSSSDTIGDKMFNKSMIALLGLVISVCFGAVEAEASPTPSWRVNSSVDEMTDEVSHYAFLLPIAVEGASGVPAHKMFMQVTCTRNETILTIWWGTYVTASEHRVIYRLDDEPAVSRNWVSSVSTSRSTSYPVNASDFLKQIIDSNIKYFRVRTIPFIGGPTTLLFDVSEMGSALTNIRRGCGW